MSYDMLDDQLLMPCLLKLKARTSTLRVFLFTSENGDGVGASTYGLYVDIESRYYSELLYCWLLYDVGDC
jgi:hypothetical protein